MEKSCPQMLLAGGRKVQTFAVTLSCVETSSVGADGLERVSLHLLCSQANICLISCHKPLSLPLWADSWLPAGGEGYLGLLPGSGGCTGHAAGQQLPSSTAPLLLACPGFSKAPDDRGMSVVPLSFLEVKEALPCPGEDVGCAHPVLLRSGAPRAWIRVPQQSGLCFPSTVLPPAEALTGGRAEEQRGAGGWSLHRVSGQLWQRRVPLNTTPVPSHPPALCEPDLLLC